MSITSRNEDGFMVSDQKMYRSERLRNATIAYLKAFKDAYEMYGYREDFPFIVERGNTNDVQVLEILEAARAEWNAAEKE